MFRSAVIVLSIAFSACSTSPHAVEPEFEDADFEEQDMLDRVLDMSLRDVLGQKDATSDIGAPGEGGYYARWVLRDRNGDAVRVLAFPAFHPDSYTPPPDALTLPPNPQRACFSVTARGDEPWTGTYSLQTGTMDPCVAGSPTVSYHQDENCEGMPLISGSVAGPGILKHEGMLYYGAQRLTSGEYYQRSVNGCSGPLTAAQETSNLYVGEVVPDSYSRAFEDGTPYTLTVEY